jgi:hypothetical protein
MSPSDPPARSLRTPAHPRRKPRLIGLGLIPHHFQRLGNWNRRRGGTRDVEAPVGTKPLDTPVGVPSLGPAPFVDEAVVQTAVERHGLQVGWTSSGPEH